MIYLVIWSSGHLDQNPRIQNHCKIHMSHHPLRNQLLLFSIEPNLLSFQNQWNLQNHLSFFFLFPFCLFLILKTPFSFGKELNSTVPILQMISICREFLNSFSNLCEESAINIFWNRIRYNQKH